jgi:hypothetical protein
MQSTAERFAAIADVEEPRQAHHSEHAIESSGRIIAAWADAAAPKPWPAFNQSFLAHLTWKQEDLARELSIGVERLRRMLDELREKEMPLHHEEDHPDVYCLAEKDQKLRALLAIVDAFRIVGAR